MIIYSKKILLFINEIQQAIREILSQEIGLQVRRSRFSDRRRKASYPIHVVIYNNKSMLGYFDPHFYELGFHECLMHSSKKQLHHVIRHELAHYITFIEYGPAIQPHGKEFKTFCQTRGWNEEVHSATFCLEEAQSTPDTEESSILRKVQKLMALTHSSNQNEAEQAMIKSQQLLLKYNIHSKYTQCQDDEKVILKRIMKQKKEDAKMRSIAKILETFFVNTVFNRTGGFTYLEILGSNVNVEIATYVADVLQCEMDKLWDQARQQSRLKGSIAKNSFFLGLAKGYCTKIQALKREYQSEMTHALMAIEKKLMDAKSMAYPQLSLIKSRAHYCPKSSALGEQMGRKLNIHNAVHKESNNRADLISY